MPILFAVNGTVTDGTSGGPVPNAVVQIGDGANTGKSAATDVSGSYTIGGVAPGTFSLSAAAANYETAIKPVALAANPRVDFVLQRICTFTVRPLTLSFTRGGFPATGGTGYSLDISASAPSCTWTASDDANDWLFLQVQGSGAPYSHAVSGSGSAVVFAAANAYGGANGTRTTVVRVRWTVGGVDIVACQPDC